MSFVSGITPTHNSGSAFGARFRVFLSRTSNAVLFASVFFAASVGLQFRASLRQHCAVCGLRGSLGACSAAIGKRAVSSNSKPSPNKSLKLTASNRAASQFALFSVPSALRASAAA